MGKTFKVIRTLLDKDAGINVCKTVDFIIDNRLVCDYNVISNKFNDYFGSILANSIHCNVNPLLYVDNIPNSIVIPDISQEAVISVIKSLKNSAPGYDDIPTSVMKKCINDYIAPLTYLVNISIKQGIFPDELKIAKVFPIFKSNDEQYITNYRPISVLNFFSKIFEKIVANRIIDFLDQNDVFYDHQYGFRKCHSTNHAIITLVEKVAKALDSGKIVVGVYLDIRKAFDAISHPILLKKLYALGIRGNIYYWVKSYLTNRSQFVLYNNSKSEKKNYFPWGAPRIYPWATILYNVYERFFQSIRSSIFDPLR